MPSISTGGVVGHHLWRWMLFVDGENLTIRAQDLAASNAVLLHEGPYYRRDVCIWMPPMRATQSLTNVPDIVPVHVHLHATRAFYYTSVIGGDDILWEVKEQLRAIGFTPEVFKKPKGKKAKAVDITLAKDMLSNAFLDNYDVAVLVAGDGDYVPLVAEVQRLGKVVYVISFEQKGLSSDLKMAADVYFTLDEFFWNMWRRQPGSSIER